VESVFTIHVPPLLTVLQVVRAGGVPLITFYADGRITVAEDAQPSETARQVLEQLALQFPQWLRKPE
jgi:hypothetical protein